MRKKPIQQQGFSLVELMIAMVVLAIGIMATMAMQYTALASYSSAREMTGATEVARVVEQRMRTESLQWQKGQAVSTIEPIYTGGKTLINSITATTWTNAFADANPVTLRVDDQGPQRFCSFVQGEALPAIDSVPQDYMWAIVAVVYRAPGAGAARIEDGDCNDELAALLDTTDRQPLELEGYRVTFVSTSVQPRQQ